MHRKYRMNLHLFDENAGNGGQNAGNGNGSQGNAGTAGTTGASGNGTGSGTFTYDQLDEIATSRAERAERSALKSFFQQKGLTEEEANAAIDQYKADKAAKQPDISAVEKERDQYKQQLEERDHMDYLRRKGVREEDLDYVAFQAKKGVNKDTDFKKSADKYLKDNPRYAGTGYRVNTSTGTAATGSSRSQHASINDSIRNAFKR